MNPTSTPPPVTTRALRFHSYGEPLDVLRLEEAQLAAPAPGFIRIKVQACGLTPADWALCHGLFAGNLPRGIGLEVSGTVDALGEGVTGISLGDAVLGPADFATTGSAGAADYATLKNWAKRPDGLDPSHAAALPMAVETAYRSLDLLGVTGDSTVLIHGAGTTVGLAAVQIALLRGANVLATAGQTFADKLQAWGAQVTPYGEGMVERVLALNGGQPDLILDTSPVSGVLPSLVEIAGDPSHVLTISDFEAAKTLGVRTSFGEDSALRHDVLSEFASLAAEGRFEIPIAQKLPLDQWRDAVKLSTNQKAKGKIILEPALT